MLDDAQAPVLVTQESLLEALPPHSGSVVCIDRDWTEIAARPATAPLATVDRDSLAYVIYTSGSTGRPKGVEIRHSSVVNLLASMRERPGLTEDDVVVNVTTPAFDLSVPDLYLPLVCGAKLVIASRETAQDPARLAGAPRGHRCDTHAGDSDDMADARRGRLGGPARAEDRLRRRGAPPQPCERARRPRSVALAHVRADRDDRLVVGAAAPARRRAAADRRADREHALLRRRPPPPAGADRRRRRAPDRRRRARTRLSRPRRS